MPDARDTSPPDRVARALAVALLVVMVVLSATGRRDDKAWKMWTDPIKEWAESLGG